MFGKKKQEKKEKDLSEKEIHVQTIPDVFYGGKDPEIYHAQFKASSPKGSSSSSVAGKKGSTDMRNVQPHVPTIQEGGVPLYKKKRVLVSTMAVFILVLGGFAWYQVELIRKQKAERLAQLNPVRQEAIQQESTPPVEQVAPSVVTSTDSSTVTSTEDIPEEIVTSTNDVLTFPTLFFAQSPDLDSDQLTDLEEEIFGTDSGTWDSDDDGYYDGQEVANLYNPRGLAPRRLIDSGLVREYVNPLFQYRMYYPQNWSADPVDDAGTRVLLSAITGDYIEVRSFPKSSTVSFQEWFATIATGEIFTNLIPLKNRFDVNGFKRQDGLVAYFPTEENVYVVIYHPGSQQQIAYPFIMNMVIQSFRPSRTTVELPDQPVLPDAQSTSTQVEEVSATSSSFFE